MTELTITPKIADKSARFKGTVAAGETVAVTILGAEGIVPLELETLRLRVLGGRGETLAQFPMPAEGAAEESAEENAATDAAAEEVGADGEEDYGGGEADENAWTLDGDELRCTLNLATAQMMSAVRPAETRQFLFVLDDAEHGALYFKDFCEITHWPQRLGEDAPTDLRGYRDFVKETAERIDRVEADFDALDSSIDSALAAKASNAALQLEAETRMNADNALSDAIDAERERAKKAEAANADAAQAAQNAADHAEDHITEHALDDTRHITAEERERWNAAQPAGDYATRAELADAIAPIVGEDAGRTMRQVSAEEVAKIVADAPADFDTLKELADWIASDTTGAAKMQSDIATLESRFPVKTDDIADKAVTNAKIANNTIGGAKLVNGAIGTAQLKDGGVTTAKLSDGAVTEAKLSDEVKATLDGKADDSAVVHLDGAETVNGSKTFASDVRIAKADGTQAVVSTSSLSAVFKADGEERATRKTYQYPAEGGTLALKSDLDAKLDRAKNVTWAEVKELRDGAKLVPGASYRITDYVATTAQADTRSANHPFDVIVTADSADTLNETARAALHEGDEYFAGCNLAAWRIQYCLDNDADRFAWAVADGSVDAVTGEGGKGVIYRMVDEFDNDIPYDFKGVQFKYGPKWYITFSGGYYSSESDQSIALTAWNFRNKIECRDFNYNKRRLERNLFMGIQIYDNVLFPGCYNIIIESSSHFNILHNNCHDISFGQYCVGNSLGHNCTNISFRGYCVDNTLGPDSSGIVYGYRTYRRTIGYGAMKHVLADGEGFTIERADGTSVRLDEMRSLAGETMPETPTQKEVADAVKKVFAALGGTVASLLIAVALPASAALNGNTEWWDVPPTNTLSQVAASMGLATTNDLAEVKDSFEGVVYDATQAAFAYTDAAVSNAVAALRREAETAAADLPRLVTNAVAAVLAPSPLEFRYTADGSQTITNAFIVPNNATSPMHFTREGEATEGGSAHAFLYPSGTLRNYEVVVDALPAETKTLSWTFDDLWATHRIYATPTLYEDALGDFAHGWRLTADDLPCVVTIREPEAGLLVIRRDRVGGDGTEGE